MHIPSVRKRCKLKNPEKLRHSPKYPNIPLLSIVETTVFKQKYVYMNKIYSMCYHVLIFPLEPINNSCDWVPAYHTDDKHENTSIFIALLPVILNHINNSALCQ